MTLALWGSLTGTLGLMVALLVYFRDAPRVVVGLNWNMQGPDGGTFVVISIANVGRRSIYLSHAHIRWPTKGTGAALSLETVDGVTLAEGSKPKLVMLQQSTLEARLAGDWWRIRATVVDVAGRAYRSRWHTSRPDFATEEAPPGAIVVAHVLNAFDTFRLRLLA